MLNSILDNILHKRRWSPKKAELIEERLIEILSKINTIDNFEKLTNRDSNNYRVSFDYQIFKNEVPIENSCHYLCSYYSNNGSIEISPLQEKIRVPPSIIHLFKYIFPDSNPEFYDETSSHIWRGIGIEELFKNH